MKKLLATLLILPLFLTSCLGNDEPVESTTTLKYLGNNHIYSSEETILKNAEYTLDMNFTAMTTTLTINSAYTSNGEPVTIRLKDIKMEFSQDKGYTFQVAEMVPEVSDGNAEDYAVSNLNARIYPYYKSDDQVGMKQIIIMEISYRLGHKYQVFACNPSPEFPNTSTTTYGDGAPYETTKTTYSVKFDKDNKHAAITIQNAQFAETMPMQTMELKNVPVTVTQTGYTLATDKVIPEINGVPFEQFAITDLAMYVGSNGMQMNIGFKCQPMGKSYQVNGQGSAYPDIQDSNKIAL